MAEADEVVADDVEEEADEPTKAYCRHCGQPHEVNTEQNPDWLCPKCERYQQAVVCPTCKSVVNVSVLPADQVPTPHARARRAMLRAVAAKTADAGGKAHGKGAGIAASGKEG